MSFSEDASNSPSAALIPLTMCASTVQLDQSTGGWNLSDVRTAAASTPDGRRSFRHWIEFSDPFGNLPVVHVGLAGFDIDNRDTARLAVGAEKISSQGFELKIETWGCTRVYQVTVNWLAMGQ